MIQKKILAFTTSETSVPHGTRMYESFPVLPFLPDPGGVSNAAHMGEGRLTKEWVDGVVLDLRMHQRRAN